MYDEHVLNSQKSVEFLATKVPKITVQRAEEIVPIVKEILVSVLSLFAQKWMLPTFNWIHVHGYYYCEGDFGECSKLVCTKMDVTNFSLDSCPWILHISDK
jgi:hypothetical protein